MKILTAALVFSMLYLSSEVAELHRGDAKKGRKGENELNERENRIKGMGDTTANFAYGMLIYHSSMPLLLSTILQHRQRWAHIHSVICIIILQELEVYRFRLLALGSSMAIDLCKRKHQKFTSRIKTNKPK